MRHFLLLISLSLSLSLHAAQVYPPLDNAVLEETELYKNLITKSPEAKYSALHELCIQASFYFAPIVRQKVAAALHAGATVSPKSETVARTFLYAVQDDDTHLVERFQAAGFNFQE